MEKDVKKQTEKESAPKKGLSMKKVIWICAAVVLVLALVYAALRLGGKGTDSASGSADLEVVADFASGSAGLEIVADSASGSAGLEIVADSASGSADQEVVADADRETFEIPFAGLVLKYPKEWQDQVTVAEQEDGSLAFAAEDSPLFPLYADGNHSILGTVISETNTILSVEFAQIDQNDTTRMAMQKDINVIIHHLSMDYDFEIGAAVEDEDDSTFQIETSVTTLYYPAKWQDRITVNVTDEKVSFSAGETPLFDLVFTKCDGYLLGTYGSTPIYIMEYPVTEQEHAAMQMGVNVILEHLQEDDQFIMN